MEREPSPSHKTNPFEDESETDPVLQDAQNRLERDFAYRRGSPEQLRVELEYEGLLERHGRALLMRILERRSAEGDDLSEEQLRMFHLLQSGTYIPRNDKPVPVPGKNTTIPCVIESGDELIPAFSKPETGETLWWFDESYDQFFRVIFSCDSHGRIRRKLLPMSPDEQDLQAIRENRKNFPLTARLLSARYDIDGYKLPISENLFGYRPTDFMHAERSAVATSWLSALMGFDAAPETVRRIEDIGPISVQRAINGKYLSIDVIADILKKGERHPLMPGIIATAALQYANMETDGTASNTLWVPNDEHGNGGGIVSIDNGYAFPYTLNIGSPDSGLTLAERTSPLDTPFNSISWDILARFPGWKLTDEQRDRIREITEEVRDYQAIRRELARDPTMEEQLSRMYPKHVLNGEAANMLFSMCRYVYERLDEHEHIIRETEVVAQQEFSGLIARLEWLATHGRPPRLGEPFRKERNLNTKILEYRSRPRRERLAEERMKWREEREQQYAERTRSTMQIQNDSERASSEYPESGKPKIMKPGDNTLIGDPE